MKLRFLFVACLTGLLGIQHSSSQTTGSLLGQVIDARTGDPISEGLIQILGTNHSALLDNNGRYSLLAVPPGVYDLLVFPTGTTYYDRDTIHLVRFFPGRADTLIIKLYPYGSRNALEDIQWGRITISPSADLLRIIPSAQRDSITRRYGFQPDLLAWFWCGTRDVYRLGSVYDEVVTAYLEARNGKDWPLRFRNELEAWIAGHQTQLIK